MSVEKRSSKQSNLSMITIAQDAREQTTMKCLINLEHSMNWDIEKAMDAIGINDTDRELYRRSLAAMR